MTEGSILVTHLLVRGEAYPIHYKEIGSELANYTKYCFSIDILGFLNNIDLMIKYIGNNMLDPFPNMKSLFGKFKELDKSSLVEIEKENSKLKERVKEELLNPQNKFNLKDLSISDGNLDTLSLEFGDNSDWQNLLELDKIICKPLIKNNSDYYCFLPQHLTRNKKLIIENYVDSSKKELYKKLKGEYFEEKVKETFKKILQSKNEFQRLFDDSGREIDLIIEKDVFLFLIEIKGTKRRLFSETTNIYEQTREDFEVSIKKAFEQVNKTYEYIQK